jgi:hypothetical protein
MKDEFLRLYLFNNTLLRLRLNNKDPSVRVGAAKDLLLSTLDRFKGTIRLDTINSSYDVGRRLTTLQTMFQYPNFKTKFDYSLTPNLTLDKLWKLKYLLLVLVRHNHLLPNEIERIFNHIEKAKDDIDIYIYIFWQKVVLLNTVAPEIEERDFMPELDAEYNQIKKLSIGDITMRVSSNTEQISYIFKASLTPSGYLYNPPTP